LPLTVKWMPAHLKAFQKLLFSATLSQNPEALEKLHLFEPKLFTSIVDRKKSSKEVNQNVPEDQQTINENQPTVAESFVGKYSTPTELKESFVLCKKETKPLVLTYLISHFKWKRVLCFANTKESTHRLCLLLKFMGHLNVREVSAKWSPKTRDIVLKKFAEGSIDMYVFHFKTLN
jgi:ATP-dependent RNA helicase DDX51/DBP6